MGFEYTVFKSLSSASICLKKELLETQGWQLETMSKNEFYQQENHFAKSESVN